MIERLNREKCIGCGTCAEICPMDVLRLDPESGSRTFVIRKTARLATAASWSVPSLG